MKSLRFFLFLLILSVTTLAWGQEMGTITGKVTDDDGVAMPGTLVTVEGTNISATADAEGNFTLSVPTGSYTLRASTHSYRPETATVTVSPGQTATQDFTLQVDLLALEEMVVTGTATPEKKIESSTSITTLNIDEINNSAPRSTTEYLRRVPGFTRVESSGGEVNQNLSVRGLLGVEVVNLQEDGMPVYPTMHIFFLNGDNLIRPDENLAEVEVVRGGNSPIFASSAAAIVNFINKTGGDELHGVVKGSGGSKGLGRFDFNVNGPLTEDWRFNVGGFYRYDHGARDPGFPGISGGQIKASVTRLLENGFFRIATRYLDDRNIFYLGLPFRNPDDPEYVAGFADDGTLTSNEGVDVEVPLPRGNGDLVLPLDKGISTKASYVTGQFNYNFAGDWEFENIARVMSADNQWNAMPPGQLLQGTAYAQGILNGLISNGTVPAGSTFQLLFTNHKDARTGNKLPFDTANGLVSTGGLFHVDKPISDFSDQLTIRKLFGKHRVAFGTYFAHYTQDNTWYLPGILTDVRDNPRFLDLVIVRPDGTTFDVTKNGFRRFLDFYRNGSGSNSLIALFGHDEIKISDVLRVDGGFRYERNNYFQIAENGSTFDLDGNPATLYDNEFFGNSTFRQFNFDIDDVSYYVGFNYQLTPNRLAVYGSFTHGFWMPALDEFLETEFPEQVELFETRKTNTVEGGIKYASPVVAFTATAFYGKLFNVTSRGVEIDPITGRFVFVTRSRPDTSGWGMEFEVSVRPTSPLRLNAASTIVDIEATGAAQAGQLYDGLTPAVTDFEATYALNGSASLLFDWHYVAERFASTARIGRLASYAYMNLGASYGFRDQGITLAVRLLNVTDSFGLEEGDPRVDPTLGPTADLFTARPLLPRRVTFEMRYEY